MTPPFRCIRRQVTTDADTTGRFRYGVTTIANSRSSTTAQSGGYATQQATSAPSHTQQGTPPRLSQRSTQPMEWMPTTMAGDATIPTTPPRSKTCEAPPRHRQETTQPMDTSNGDPSLTTTTEPAAQYRCNGELEAPTEPLAQYQRTGEGQMSRITDAAQLNHPLSRADDVDLPSAPATPRPDTRELATSRRRIGGRCHKWAVSTQNASQPNKRKCASCTMCGQQFTPGEPRLQQWANRDKQRAYVHAQCVTGGIGRDHELVAKAPTDNEARDTFIRLRDSVLSAAAAGGPPHPRSTRRQLYGGPRRRRPIVRQGGGIASTMTKSWNSNGLARSHGPTSEDLRGTTYVQPPARHRFALEKRNTPSCEPPMQPDHPQTHATTQRTWTVGHARRALVRIWHPGRRQLLFIFPDHRSHRHGHCPGCGLPVLTRRSGHTTRQTHRRTQTAPHDVFPTETRAQSDHSG